MANLLAQSTSPYLLQHKDNPVDWRPWGPEALAEAQRLNKPILLSVGYSACHWCHVMAHESFENPEIAALMNEHFISIKVDREERPDIDTIYQTALGMMGQQGGWPLTMFLTPAGEPFLGGTYFPPKTAMGRPGFAEVLVDVARVYRENQTQVQQNTKVLQERLAQGVAAPAQSRELTPDVLDLASKRLCQQMDVFNGGLNGAPKFPQVPALEMLWRAFTRSSLTQFIQAVDTALMNMSQGGIYDHLGGGFFRYSTDELWLVPHFEKMLYDNAQLIDVLSLVYPYARNPIYRARVEETVAWALREMLVEGGAFATALDADSEGEEGKYYVWTDAEVDAVLGKDAAFFKMIYDVRPSGNWDGKSILHRLSRPLPLSPVDEGKLNAMREKLLANRSKRTRPGFDDKVLADWNGLMIAALANAAETFNRADWQAAAVKAFWFVAETMADGDRLYHSWRAGKPGAKGFAEDHANMAKAALALYEATGHAPYLEKARAWVKTLNDHFWSRDHGGYAMTPDDGEQLIIRVRSILDGATPVASGTMMGVLARLFYLTGEPDYAARTRIMLANFGDDARRQVIGAATFYNGFDLMLRGQQIVIIGQRNDPAVNALRDVVRRNSLPNKVLNIVPPGQPFPVTHPAYGKGQVDGKATVYLCSARACSAPITDANVFEMQLKTRTTVVAPPAGAAPGAAQSPAPARPS